MDELAPDETLVASDASSGPGERAVSVSRVAGLEAGERIGRYLVIRKLGAGAMGVVYAAYDPKLDRKVALKLLAGLAGDRTELARQRLRREAQALAKLAHPHVVGVYDVEIHEGQLYVAMEFVAGQTLGTWMREHEGPRPWRSVVDVFIQAGSGLAAAHAAGLIHRDFKPENAMIGDDGRVRVMDFGLARPQDASPKIEELRANLSDELGPRALESPLTSTGSAMGTPAYMALEQFEGRADARSDQFGFCVALYEALYGERPFAARTRARLLGALAAGAVEPPPRGSVVPAWLRALVLRGLEPEPDQRWPSMDELLEALVDDPGQRRRRWAGTALVVALVGGVAGGALWSSKREAQACVGFEAKLAGIWDDAVEARVEAAFEDTGLVYAADSFRGAKQGLDDYAQAWVAARRDTCEATQRGEQSGELLDRRMACLDERLQHVAATVGLLEAADESIAGKAIDLVSGLPGLGRCADIEALTAEVPSPDDPDTVARVEALDARLIEANALARGGKYEAGLELATKAVTDAEALDYEPVQVRAWLAQANLQEKVGAYPEAETTLERAYASALGLTMVPEAAQAAKSLVWVVGYRQARHADARAWAEHTRPLARAADIPTAEANHFNSLGAVARAEGKLEEARAAYERVLAIREQALNPDHPGIATAVNNLGNVLYSQGKYGEARAYLERALALRERVLGPDHPEIAHSHNTLGAVAMGEGKYEEARTAWERALAIRERALGSNHPELAFPLNNLGNLALSDGKYEEARAYYQRALVLFEQGLGPEHHNVGSTLTNLGMIAQAQGKLEEARAHYQRALAVLEKTLGPEHPQVAYPLSNLGSMAQAAGSYEEARAHHERVLAIRDKALGPEHPEVASALKNLGLAMLGLERPTQALVVLERALSIHTRNPSAPVSLAATRFSLARALWDAPADAGRDRARAAELAALAREAHEAAGEMAADELAEVRAWQLAHKP